MNPFHYEGDLGKLSSLTSAQAKKLKYGDLLVRIKEGNEWFKAGFVYAVSDVVVKEGDNDFVIGFIKTFDAAVKRSSYWRFFALKAARPLPVCRKEDIL